MLDIDVNWQYYGLRLIRIENELVSLDVLPELGAKIYNFIHKPSGRNLLWHNPHLPPQRQPFGAGFDDNWCGGWDELLPNDLPRPGPDGDLLPDHGEVWSQPADWQVLEAGSTRLALRFTSYGRVLPTRFDKTISLQAGEPFVRLHYGYTNLGPDPIDFLWNIHPALVVSPHTWLDVPAIGGLTDPWHETRFVGGRRFQWPDLLDREGRRVDLRRVGPPRPDGADMHYLVDVQEGWYAATDQGLKVGFALSFPKEVFPHVWLFRALGGWRGLYTLILEASTGHPYDLDVARQNGTCAHLVSQQTLEADVLAIAYAGLSSVSHVSPEGRVVPGKM